MKPEPTKEQRAKIGRDMAALRKPENMARTPEQARKAALIRWAKRPHLKKADYFESIFPHALECNEWRVKWSLDGQKVKTYNPDYYCPKLQCYIEVCTSIPNYSEGRTKWAKAISDGHPLRVYWWEGDDITELVISDKSLRFITLRQRNSQSQTSTT